MRSLPTRKKKSQRAPVRASSNHTSTRKKTNPTWIISKNVKIGICELIESKLSTSRSGRYPKGALKEMIDLQLALHGSWLTADMIKGYLKRRRQKKEAMLKATISPPLQQEHNYSVAGRPVGTTKLELQERHNKFEEMKNVIVQGWADVSKKPEMTLPEWIHKNQILYGFSPEQLTSAAEIKMYSVKKSMVYSRIYRKRLVSRGQGQPPMLASIEPRIVMFIKMSSKCNQEMIREEVLEFVNAYIKGSKLEQNYIAWKTIHHKKWRSDYDADETFESGQAVGKSWFKNFCKRWASEIGYLLAKNTANYQKDHCQYLHFVSMYNNVYELLVKHGYGEIMNNPCFFDSNGQKIANDVVVNDGIAPPFGKRVDVKFIRPDLVFVADECGSNTNMSKDKLSAGNDKYVHAKGCGVTLPRCTSDTHFLTMGITSLTEIPSAVW